MSDQTTGARTRVLVGSVLGLAVSAPSYVYAFAVYLKPIASETGWSRGAILLGVSISGLVAALLTPLAGLAVDRAGPRRVGLWGAVALPFGVAALGLPHSYGAFLTAAVAGGLACAVSSPASYLALQPQWFDRRLGMALAAAATGIGLAGVWAPAVNQALIARLGWRHATLACGAIVAVVAVASNLLLIRENPAFVRARALARTTEGRTPLEGASLGEGLAAPDFWTMGAAFFLVITVVSGLIVNLPALAADRGYTAGEAAASLALYGGISILARLATGVMLDRLPSLVPAALFFSGAGVAVVLLWTGRPHGSLGFAAALLGAATGCEADLLPFVVRRRFGLRAYGRLYGLMFSLFLLGPIIGPLALGIVFDRAHTYGPAFPVLLALVAAALLLSLVSRALWLPARPVRSEVSALST